MSTVSLQIIVKDEVASVIQIVALAYDHVDQIVLTVSDKPACNKLKKHLADPDSKLTIVWREWTDDFAAARNANFELCTSDYAFWMDADDEFDFTKIQKLVQIADEDKVDELFLPYNYAQDERGNCVTRHWRERLLRMSLPWEWRGRVHETCILDQDHNRHKVNVEVIHRSDKGQQSYERNHKILEKAYEETDDPRYTHYLGMSYFAAEEYEKCIDILNEYLQVGGSIEDSYRSLSVISEAAYHLGAHDTALEFANKAAILKPAYPMAYWLLAQYEADQKNWEEALEWIRVGETKPDPETLSVWDPSARSRAALIGAQCEFMLGNYNAALAWLKKAGSSETADDLYDDFVKEADAETFINWLPKMMKYFESPELLWQGLCKALKYDNRLLSLRQQAIKPKTWIDKEITIFCGQGYEEWGPNTLDKGMGGSEEAVVYLAPELVKLGYYVTVYGEVPEPQTKDGVLWLPWQMIDTRDEFNIFISWRAPQFLDTVNAKVKLCDMHDVLPASIVKNNPDVTYLVKSQYHRDLYKDVPDERFVIIGNGISKEQFS